MSFEGENLMEMDLRFMILKKMDPGAIYKYITIKFKELLI